MCVSDREAKNLAEVEPQQEKARAGAATWNLLKPFPSDVRGKILQYAVREINKGRAEEGVKSYIYCLKALVKKGANLYDPESVKSVIATTKEWTNSKTNKVLAYDGFLKFLGGTWEKPKYKIEAKIPFIPLETEIDQLISGTSKMVSTALKIGKETGARSGEIGRLKWTDVDSVRKIININEPEKGSNTRSIKISAELVAMIKRLPRKGDRLFKNIKATKRTFTDQRNRLAHKLENPRLKAIHFHTLRHWKGTMEYHETKDPLHVMYILGHKNFKNTQVYIQIEKTLFKGVPEHFISKVAHTIDEACLLVDDGFDYVCDFNGTKIFRKRK